MHRYRFLRLSFAVLFLLLLASFSWTAVPVVNIRFLGTGTPDFVVSNPRMQSGILVDVEGERWLLDAGAGVLARMFDHRIDPASVDHIFISHLHYDHCLDLDAILFAWSMAGPALGTPDRMRDRKPLNLWGPDGIDKMLSGLYENAYAADGRGRPLLNNPLLVRRHNREGASTKPPKTEVGFSEVRHVPGMDCWAIRLRTPRGAVIYTGDIGNARRPGPVQQPAANRPPGIDTYEAHDDFAKWARGAEMLIIDTLHLSPEVLAKIVATAAPKTVVFSHMAERPIPIFQKYDAKRAAELAGKSGVKVVVATEGMSLTL